MSLAQKDKCCTLSYIQEARQVDLMETRIEKRLLEPEWGCEHGERLVN